MLKKLEKKMESIGDDQCTWSDGRMPWREDLSEAAQHTM